MGEALFVLKCLAVTAAIVLLGQIRWNGATLEERTAWWARTSPVTMTIREAAEGGAVMASETISKAQRWAKQRSPFSETADQRVRATR